MLLAFGRFISVNIKTWSNHVTVWSDIKKYYSLICLYRSLLNRKRKREGCVCTGICSLEPCIVCVFSGWMARVHPDWQRFMIHNPKEGESDECGRLSESVRKRWRRNASSLLWWVRITWVFHDKSKSARSERGQGGSVAVNADNLSAAKAISCFVSQPAQETRSDMEIFPVCPASNLFFRIRPWGPFFLFYLLLFYIHCKVLISFPAA